MQWQHSRALLQGTTVARGGAVAGELRGLRGLVRPPSHHQHNLVETAAVFSPSSLLHSQARSLSKKKFDFTENPEVPFLERIGLRRRQYRETQQQQAASMSHHLYTDETPADVKNAKGLHLLTMNTPNGQAVQIYLEELKDLYGIEWTTTLINIMTNDQKKDWFLRLDPNGTCK